MGDIVVTFFDDKGDLITNKKLQKLLYYIESWFLVYDSSIIDDDFEAWVHGPVIPAVYSHYKGFGYSPIKNDYSNNETSSTRLKRLLKPLNKNQKELFYAILEKYSSLQSFQLEMLSHSEKPWIEARKGLKPFEPSSGIIDKKVMKKYYKSLLNGEK